MKKKKWQIIFGLSLCLLVAGGIYFYLNTSKPTNQQQIAGVSLKDLQPRLDFYLTGVIEPNKTTEYKLDKTKGTITEKKVEIGDQVKVGQVLYLYSNPEGDMTVKEAEFKLETARKLVEQRQKETNLKWTTYNRLIDRIKELEAKVPEAKKEELEELKKSIDEMGASIDQAALDAETSENEISNAGLEVEKAELALTTAQKSFGEHEIKSEVDGMVKSIDLNQMNLTDSEKKIETPFMTIIDTSKLFLRGKVDEFRRQELKIDQKVTVIDRKDESKRWTGKVVKVADMAAGGVVDEAEGNNPNLSLFSFEVLLDASDAPPAIGSHDLVELVEEAVKQLLIPKEYVRAKEGKFHVWLVEKEKIIDQQLNLKEYPNDGDFYLLEGELAETVQLVFPNKGIKAGMEVGDYVGID